MLIGDREGIAEHAVPGRKLPLEVRRPEIIGRGGGGWHDAGVATRSTAAAGRQQLMPPEKIVDRADGRPGGAGMARGQIVQELARAPIRMVSARSAEQRRQGLRDPMRAVMRGPTPVAQALAAFLGIPREPLITGLPADPVASAELGHGVEVLAVIRDKVRSLVHGVGLQPGHRSVSRSGGRPSSLDGVSPMFPDRSVTYLPGLTQVLANPCLQSDGR